MEWDIAAAANAVNRCSLHKDTNRQELPLCYMQLVSGSREQKKLQRTGNSGWLVFAAILDCSHLLLIVVVVLELRMQCLQRNTSLTAVHSSSIIALVWLYTLCVVCIQ